MDDLTSQEWPFADARDVAVFTVKQVIEQALPILHVCHEEDDGGWQFLTGLDLDMADAVLVSLDSVVRADPSIAELADLPLGHEAARTSVGAPWQRSRQT